MTQTDPVILATSYHQARWLSLVATAVLAVLAGGFLIPLVSKQRAATLRNTPDRTDKQDATLHSLEARANNPVFALFLGKDGRLSTSSTIAWVWTFIIVWILLALVIAWPSDWDTALKNLNSTYFLLLGGPYAAWVLAKGAVSRKVATKKLQKPPGDGVARLSDLVTGDDGNPDLFDIQYVMFNVTAMAFVVAAFIHSSANGFTEIPQGLLFLTGGPAAVYVGNKALAGNGPTIFSVAPATAVPDAVITIYGQNFVAGDPSTTPAAGQIRVLVGGVECSAVDPTDSVVQAVAPQLPFAAIEPQDVTVITATGAPAQYRAALRIRNAPSLLGMSAAMASQGSTVQLTGEWYDPATAALTLLVDDTVALSPAPGTVPTAHSASFQVPNLGLQPGAQKPVTLVVIQDGRRSSPTNCVITG